MPRRTDAFSLIELLVVVTIVVLLAGLLLPAIGLVRTQARTAMCAGKLHQIGVAATSYAGDYEGLFPPSFSNPNTWMWIRDQFGGPHGLGFLIDDYLDQRTTLACPETNLNNSYGNFASIAAFTKLYTGYRYCGNAYPNPSIDYFTGDNTGSVRGPTLIPKFMHGVNNAGISSAVLAYDTIAESTNPKQVFHPHPRDSVTRPAGAIPQVEGGNILYADCHVGFLAGVNWIQNGPYGRYIPWKNY